MNKIKAFFKNIFVINVLIIGIVSLLGLFGIIQYLDWYTHQGEEITVPDFKGLDLDEVEKLSKSKELQIQIQDTAYSGKMAKNAVLGQQPEADSKVKRGRTIYLTINASEAPKVPIKNLTDIPARQAVRILMNDGFKVDPEFEYVPNPALDWVQAVKFRDEEIEWGTRLEKGSKLVLVVGDGSDGEGLSAPLCVGYDFETMKQLLKLKRRVLGTVDSTDVTESINSAIVYRQEPAPFEKMKPSDPINIWLCDTSTFNMFYMEKLDSLRAVQDDQITP